MSVFRGLWQRTVPEELRRRLYHLRHGSPQWRPGSAGVRPAPTVSPTPTGSPTVSVIVPVYKVEEYLTACVDSVLGQTWKELQVILVDDGSPDRCGAMCDEFAKRHRRITVVHQQNGGLSNARNSGIEHATGEYLIFVDSDDVLPNTAIENLVKGIRETGADVATGNVRRFRGKRDWQAWNQRYSHWMNETWDGKPVAPLAKAVTLAEAPELLFDTTAWNKLFRRDFFVENAITFPEGKLYEDMLPMAQAFLAARTIVKVPSVVYLYREREDNTSITQKRGELKNLADKMEMIWRIEGEVRARGGASEAEALDTLYFKALEGDLCVYSAYVGGGDEFDRVYLDSLSRLWSAASRKAKLALALDRRALYVNQLFGDYHKAERESAWVEQEFHRMPLVMRDGVLEVDAQWNPEHLALLAEHDQLDMGRYVELREVVNDAYIVDTTLHLRGFAYLDYLPAGVAQQTRLELVGPDDRVVPLPSVVAASEQVNGYWHSGNADRSTSAYEVAVRLDELFAGCNDAASIMGEWRLRVSVTAGSYQDSRISKGYWRGGRIRRGMVAEIGDGLVVSVPWQPWGQPFKLAAAAPRFVARSMSVSEGSAELEIESRPTDVGFRVEAVRVWDGLRRPLRLIDEDDSSVYRVSRWASGDLMEVPKREGAGGHLNAWRFDVIDDNGVKFKVKSSQALAEQADLGSLWTVRTNSDGTALLHDGISTLTVDEVIPTDDGFVLRGRGDLVGYEEISVKFWSDKGATQLGATLEPGLGTFILHVPCVTGDAQARTAWAPGEYRVTLQQDGGNTRFRLRAGESALEQFPLESVNDWFRGRCHLISDTWEIAIGIFAPQRDHERGRYNEQRMVLSWRSQPDSEVTPLNAAVFSVNMGGPPADSGLAILNEIAARNTGVTLYWAVSDRSVPVPPGAEALVRGTERWFEVMSRAKLVVNNYGGISGYGDRGFQRYLQTWHGTPLKHIGDSEFAGDRRFYARKRLRAEQEAAQWDWFVSPNPFMTRLIPQEFYFTGPILDSGYPRNDALANADADRVAEIRRGWGIPESARVLVYAPTFRDVSASGFSSPLVEHLDLDRLARSLGPEWVVLLRGHSFNARADRKDRSSSRVLDLTRHADINDLLIASDVLVTDYSSVMFDYLVTGKPIVYFVPDLEQYVANRGMYFAYEDVLCGPMARTQGEVAAAVRASEKRSVDVEVPDAQVRAAYERQRERFVPWDDGSASRRVVDRIWPEIEQATGGVS